MDNFDLGLDELFSREIDLEIEADVKEISSADKEIKLFLKNTKSKSAVYKERTSVNRLYEFMHSMEPPMKKMIYELRPIELDRIMSLFFMNAKKKDPNSIKNNGELYQPDSLTSYRNGWHRVLQENEYPFDILKDKEFETSRKVLANRRKQLVGLGLGNKPCATRSLTSKEIDELFKNGYFGAENPLSLQRAIWWKISISFGFRARDESRKLCFGDIKLMVDENGAEYLEWDKERGSKTRTGETSNTHQRAFNPCAYATGGPQCPVEIYKIFVSKRPIESKNNDSPFFLAMVPNDKLQHTQPWYYNRPLGKNKLGEFLSKAPSYLQSISQNSTTSRSKISNHSVRKTAITTLLENNVDPLHVSQLSGHKNIESLNSYYVASKDQQKHMSNIINGNKSSTTVSISKNNVMASSVSSSQTSNVVNTNIEKTFPAAFFGANINNCTFNCYFSK